MTQLCHFWAYIPSELHSPPPSCVYPLFIMLLYGIQQGDGAHPAVCQQMNGYWKPGKQYKMEYYSALKKNEITKLSRKWILRMYKIKQGHQCQKEKSCKVSLICGVLPMMYACMHAKPKRCMHGCSSTCSREDREEYCQGLGWRWRMYRTHMSPEGGHESVSFLVLTIVDI